MIDHVSVAVSDLARADGFYTASLASLEMGRLRVEPRRIGFGKTYAEFWINADGGAGAGSGAHVALRAKSAEAIRAFYVAALAHGGRDDGPPGPRDRGTGPNIYYAAFVRDPDGNRIEAVTFLPPG